MAYAMPAYARLDHSESQLARMAELGYQMSLHSGMAHGRELSRLPSPWELCGTGLGMTRTEARRIPAFRQRLRALK